MDFRLSAYKQWAPESLPWSPWVKPVLFSTLTGSEPMEIDQDSLPSTDWAPQAQRSTALIVDIPGQEALYQGLALTRRGYRPVPLFNGCKAPGMVIDVTRMAELLAAGTRLVGTGIRYDAPPVFLLDSRRMDSVGDMTGLFDNRWCIFAQDMPSAKFLKGWEIQNIILRASNFAGDLEPIAYSYQKAGIKLQISRDNVQISDHTISRWSVSNIISKRWAALKGYRRNSAGGFGANVAGPMFDMESGLSSGTSTGYYHRSSYRMG